MRTLAEFTKTPLIGGILTSSWHLHFSPIFDPSSPKTAEIHRFPSATAAKAERAADRSPKITPVKGRREGGSTFIDRDCPLPRSPGRDGQGCEDHPPIHCHGLGLWAATDAGVPSRSVQGVSAGADHGLSAAER